MMEEITYNFAYGKMHKTDFGYTLEAAPSVLQSAKESIKYPNEDDYLKYGFKKIVDNPIPEKPGYIVSQDGYSETARELVANYIYIKSAHIRRFSKYVVIERLISLGIWTGVKDMLVETGYYDLFQAAQEFADNNQYFMTGIDLIKGRFGVTDDQVTEILAQAEIF